MEGFPSPKFTGAIILDLYIKKRSMSDKYHFNAPLDGEIVKAVELQEVNDLPDEIFFHF